MSNLDVDGKKQSALWSLSVLFCTLLCSASCRWGRSRRSGLRRIERERAVLLLVSCRTRPPAGLQQHRATRRHRGALECLGHAVAQVVAARAGGEFAPFDVEAAAALRAECKRIGHGVQHIEQQPLECLVPVSIIFCRTGRAPQPPMPTWQPTASPSAVCRLHR